MSFWVYILASHSGGTLYVGVTNDLIRRILEHREGLAEGFTKRFGVKQLVYFEQHETAIGAIQREKNIKHWPREWKIDLIVSTNPEWRDLYDEGPLRRKIHLAKKMDPGVKPGGDRGVAFPCPSTTTSSSR
jgi:putative endonuclease